MVCPNGHVCEPTPDAFLRKGVGCRTCAGQDSLLSYLDLLDHAEMRGFEVTGVYKNALTPISMICPEGHPCSPTPANFKTGQGCRACAKKDPVLAEKELRQRAKERGFSIIGNYTRAKNRIDMACPSGHHCSPVIYHFKNGNGGCEHCATSGFDPTKEAFLYVLVGDKGIKIGITGDLTTRMQKLKRDTPFDFSLYRVFSGVGSEVRACETIIKRGNPSLGFKGFDGATEWLVSDTLNFIDFFTSLFKVEECFNYES